MARPKQTAMEFILAALEKNKKIAYADVQKAARKRGLEVYPIMYGRAKAMLGLVPVSERGQGKLARKKKAAAKKAEAARAKTPARRPGRPRKSAPAPLELGSLQDLVQHIQESERDRERMRGALDKIRTILAEV